MPVIVSVPDAVTIVAPTLSVVPLIKVVPPSVSVPVAPRPSTAVKLKLPVCVRAGALGLLSGGRRAAGTCV